MRKPKKPLTIEQVRKRQRMRQNKLNRDIEYWAKKLNKTPNQFVEIALIKYLYFDDIKQREKKLRQYGYDDILA